MDDFILKQVDFILTCGCRPSIGTASTSARRALSAAALSALSSRRCSRYRSCQLGTGGSSPSKWSRILSMITNRACSHKRSLRNTPGPHQVVVGALSLVWSQGSRSRLSAPRCYARATVASLASRPCLRGRQHDATHTGSYTAPTKAQACLEPQPTSQNHPWKRDVMEIISLVQVKNAKNGRSICSFRSILGLFGVKTSSLSGHHSRFGTTYRFRSRRGQGISCSASTALTTGCRSARTHRHPPSSCSREADREG